MPYVMRRAWCLTADGERAVPYGDVESATILGGVGSEIDPAVADRLNIPAMEDELEAQDAAAAAEEAERLAAEAASAAEQKPEETQVEQLGPLAASGAVAPPKPASRSKKQKPEETQAEQK